MEALILLAAEAVSYLCAQQECCALSGTVLLLAAAFLYHRFRIKSGDPLDPLGLFVLSFTGGQGISCFRLSYLQTAWEPSTWLCFALAPVCFMAGRALMEKLLRGPEAKPLPQRFERTARIRKAIFVLTAVSWTAFLTEAALIGYVPLFTTDMPHAYSYFHVSGLHYFTVSFVLVPPLMVLLLFGKDSFEGGRPKRSVWAAAVCTASCILLPLLLVSRFQLILSAGLAGITFLLVRYGQGGEKEKKKAGSPLIAATAFLALAAGYIFLSIQRAHSVEYLNGIFEMKRQLPIWITQPYIYIANNYDNFNCLVRDLPAHTGGLRMLFPVIALTGLKFLRPELAAFPLYITKEELTTLTVIYDAYYDFGIAGVILFTFVLGALGALLSSAARRAGGKLPVLLLLYAQYLFYLLFSFFTTWYSNPATWFYFGVTVILLVFTGGFGRHDAL